MVEGSSLTAVKDQRQRTVQIVQYVPCSDPQCLKAAGQELSVPSLVASGLVAEPVRFSVDLNRDPVFKTGEVQDIAVERELAPEAEAVRPRTELLP
jgi:hypothetical protein